MKASMNAPGVQWNGLDLASNALPVSYRVAVSACLRDPLSARIALSTRRSLRTVNKKKRENPKIDARELKCF